jgi:hypothetical protein
MPPLPPCSSALTPRAGTSTSAPVSSAAAAPGVQPNRFRPIRIDTRFSTTCNNCDGAWLVPVMHCGSGCSFPATSPRRRQRHLSARMHDRYVGQPSRDAQPPHNAAPGPAVVGGVTQGERKPISPPILLFCKIEVSPPTTRPVHLPCGGLDHIRISTSEGFPKNGGSRRPAVSCSGGGL